MSDAKLTYSTDMTSFVAETLAAAGVTDEGRYSADLDKLSSQSDELKLEIMNFLKSKYKDFDAWLDKTCVLYKRWEQLNLQLTSTSHYIQTEVDAKLQTPSTDYMGVNGELEKVTHTLAILELLLDIHKLHQTVNDQLACQNYTQASVELNNMKEALSKLDIQPELEITKALKVEHTMLSETLKHSMTEEWNKVVKISKPESDKDKSCITICVNCNKEKVQLSELCRSLHSAGMLKMRLKPLSDALKLAFDWMVNYPNTTVTEDQNEQELTLKIEKTTNSCSPSWPSTVFKLLYHLMKPLTHRLLSASLSEARGSSAPTLMSEFVAVCGSEPIDTVIKGCLSPSVPTSQAELEKYKDVVTDTQKIQDFFEKIGFIAQGSTPMTGYMGNLNSLFANKKCQEILSKARNLMKADLYNTITLQPGDDCCQWSSFVARPDTSSETDSTGTSSIQSQMAKLSENTLKFPSCAISETVVELMNLAHTMLEEACTSTDASTSSQIVYAIRSMFELYTSVVSDYHKQSIETLPQVTALYYNNCMFLSHQLIMLANQYKTRLSKIMSDSSAVTFVDLVPLLRAMGTETFLDQIQNQRDNLKDCLRAADGFKTLEVAERFEHAHQAIKQCLHQLSHLRKVWLDVLPASNYCKTVGHLLSCVIKEMVTSVTSLEDMSADDTTKLHHLITQVQDASPGLFPGDKSSAIGHVHKHTSGWTKFKELGIVLNASLHDIVDRWADGKGPLAVEFTPEQVKNLIRALFQNTERRANALAKIH